MDTKVDNKFVHRHLSQLKILSRLMEHELDTSKGDSVALDRELAENVLDTLEIFVEDLESAQGATPAAKRERASGNDKPAVTRLN